MSDSKQAKVAQPAVERVPGAVWALGVVSMFMDISSEMIHGLLPVFLVSVLGASTATVGVVEGIGEATASISKLFSGWLSDKLRKRKMLTVIGYSLAAISKPLFAIAKNVFWVLAARFSDRIGKGIREAPREALIGDLVGPNLRGAAYGLRQSLDTVGAFVGPLLAIVIMVRYHNNFRLVFWLALIPAMTAVAVLVLGVREPQLTDHDQEQLPIRWMELGQLNGSYWGIVAVGAILTLARFSEAFLVLRAGNVGLPIRLAPLVLVVMNVVYAASAYPIGELSDRFDRRVLLGIGFILLFLADIVLAFSVGILTTMLGIGLWGLHMGMSQGLLSALVADVAPYELRGTAFGLFNFATGVALLMANLTAGVLWKAIGPSATFLAGAAFTIIGLAGAAPLVIHRPKS